MYFFMNTNVGESMKTAGEGMGPNCKNRRRTYLPYTFFLTQTRDREPKNKVVFEKKCFAWRRISLWLLIILILLEIFNIHQFQLRFFHTFSLSFENRRRTFLPYSDQLQGPSTKSVYLDGWRRKSSSRGVELLTIGQCSARFWSKSITNLRIIDRSCIHHWGAL